MAIKTKRAPAVDELYRPGVELAPRPEKLPPIEESDAFQPVLNDRCADLLEAHKRFGAEVAAENAEYQDRVAARFWKRSGKK